MKAITIPQFGSAEVLSLADVPVPAVGPEEIRFTVVGADVDSDEVLFYASSEFMSRKGIEYGSITHHPDGLPHGPHPGRAEASIGQKETKELAVMMDSFRPLKVAQAAAAFEDADYHRSWIEAPKVRL